MHPYRPASAYLLWALAFETPWCSRGGRMRVRLLLALCCASLFSVAISSPAVAGTSRRVKNVQALYNYLVYPNNLSVFSQSPDPIYSLFSSTEVKGRIAPLGAAHDLETLKTYFFGFSPPSDQSTVPSIVTGVTFRAITEKSRSVAVEVDIEFGPTALGQLQGIQPYKLREVGFFTFDKQNRITSFDLTIPYLDAALPFYRTSDPNFAASAVQSICRAMRSAWRK